jgi:hypothetical protein
MTTSHTYTYTHIHIHTHISQAKFLFYDDLTTDRTFRVNVYDLDMKRIEHEAALVATESGHILFQYFFLQISQI